MILHTKYDEIIPNQWAALANCSPTVTWFQTKEAYDFYASMPNLMKPFVYGVSEEGKLVGVVVGYVTIESSFIKQCMTRRAIIIGGPLLDKHISSDVLRELLSAVRIGLHNEAIYIESRNFHDYSQWRKEFEECGFVYLSHLNFQIDTSSIECVEINLGKSRKRDIKTTIREGAKPVMQPTIEQVRAFYLILKKLYVNKVKTPLFPLCFFEELYRNSASQFLLIEYCGRIIGGTVCVVLPGYAVYEWFVCGEDGMYPHIFPSSYATYLGIRYAAEHECPMFDMMGAGKPNEVYGVRDFKAKFGGKEVEYGRFLCVCKPLLYQIGSIGIRLLKKLK